MTARVVCVGIAVFDLIFEVADLPTTGSKYAARSRREVAGGIAANAAIAVARLGGAARLVSRIGDDAMGQSLGAALAATGVDCSGLTEAKQGGTATSAVFVDPQGERMLINHKDPMVFNSAPEAAAFTDAEAVMCDLRWPAATRLALTAASEAGVPGVLDYDLAPEDGVDLIALASHVIFSEGALLALQGGADRKAALAAVAGDHPNIAFAVTAGVEGVDWIEGRRSGSMPGLPVRAVDTLGAGDVFHGAAALALAEGRSFPEALAFANAAAALKVSRPSGPGAFPTRSEVEDMMETSP